MLHDLDETIRRLLIDAGGFDPATVDISFDIPNREWSAGITRPTLNCYLFDIHERRALREEGWRTEGRGTRESARRPPPLFFEMTYLITAWTAQVEDEHQLLWRALATLMDHPVLPEEYLQGELRTSHEWPVHTTVAQLEGVLKSPGEFWTALENQLKPSLSYVVTLGRSRRAEPTNAPPVLAGGLRLRLPEARPGGALHLRELFQAPPGAPLAGVLVEARRVPDQGEPAQAPDATVTADAEGRFALALPPGRYVLQARLGGELRRRTVMIRPPQPPRTRGGVQDVVRDQDGRPLAGVLVEVEGLWLRTVTDLDGRYAFDVPPGRYILRFQLDGWTQRREVTVRGDAYTLRLTYGGVPAEEGEG
ncbi:MAG TPA: Pvc16 family protein [Roseiflexaceae bacterium]|nr:Pvc16 family protein [Roseiflexaceae bacterium]